MVAAGAARGSLAVPRPPPRLLLAAGLILLAAATLLALYRLNLAVPLNSDQGNSLLEAVAMRHGNLLLRGWVLPPDTFYTTRVPLLALLSLFQDATPNLVAQSGAIFGLCLVAAAVWLAQGARPGARAWWGRLVTFALLVTPAYLPGQYLLFPGGSDHAGTVTLMLLAYVVLDRAGTTWAGQALLAVILASATVGDPMAAWVGAGAVAATAAVRLLTGEPDWRTELRVLGAAAASYLGAAATWHAIHLAGGFGRAGQTLAVTGSQQLPAHLALGFESLLQVFGADFLGKPVGAAVAPALLHTLGLVAVAVAVVAAFRAWGRRSADRVSQVLAAGVVIDLAAFVLNSQATDLVQSRYLLPAAAFGAILLGRAVPGIVGALRLRVAIASVAVAYLALGGVQAAQATAAAPPTTPVQRFLAARHLTEGLSDYWAASVITASSRGRIRVRAVVTRAGKVQGYLWLARRNWYAAPKHPARFVVLDLKQPGAVDRRELVKAFGEPAESHRIGRYEVLIWTTDLYPRVVVPDG